MAKYHELHDYDGKITDEATGELVAYVSSETDGAYFVTDGANFRRLFHGFMSLLHWLEYNGLIVEWF